ncbi:MAG: LacI family DNA-binding transcriptional regulator [Pseudomonadota bacterium]
MTIQDIARRAGVSTATVSRALATPEQVSERNRNKVMQAVAETGYTPNSLARNLRVQRAMTILVIVPNVANAFWPEVLRGIDDELVANRYDVIIGNIDNLVEREERYVNLAASGQVDGVLLMTGRTPISSDRSMADLDIPIVTIAAPIEELNVPQVVVNERAVSAEIAEHFLDLGHRRFGYIAGPENNINETERYSGFTDFLKRAGISDENIIRWKGDFSFASGTSAGRQFLRMNHRPTAVYAACDESAISFLKTLNLGGVWVPRDVSVIGFDGIESGSFVEPTLTTVHQPRAQMGRVAAKALLDSLAGLPVEPGLIELRAPLVFADSTAPPS